MRKLNLNSTTHLERPTLQQMSEGHIATNSRDGDIMIVQEHTALGIPRRIIKLERAFMLHEVADIVARDALYATGVILPLDMCEYTNSNGKLQLDGLLVDTGPGVWGVLEIHD